MTKFCRQMVRSWEAMQLSESNFLALLSTLYLVQGFLSIADDTPRAIHLLEAHNVFFLHLNSGFLELGGNHARPETLHYPTKYSHDFSTRRSCGLLPLCLSITTTLLLLAQSPFCSHVIGMRYLHQLPHVQMLDYCSIPDPAFKSLSRETQRIQLHALVNQAHISVDADKMSHISSFDDTDEQYSATVVNDEANVVRRLYRSVTLEMICP